MITIMIVNSAVTPFLTHINVTVAFLNYFYPHPILDSNTSVYTS